MNLLSFYTAGLGELKTGLQYSPGNKFVYSLMKQQLELIELTHDTEANLCIQHLNQMNEETIDSSIGTLGPTGNCKFRFPNLNISGSTRKRSHCFYWE